MTDLQSVSLSNPSPFIGVSEVDLASLIEDTVRHFGVEGNPAAYADNECRYRTESGTACAIGRLIPDAWYDPSMESRSASAIDRSGRLPAVTAGGTPCETSILDAVQASHDASQYCFHEYPAGPLRASVMLFSVRSSAPKRCYVPAEERDTCDSANRLLSEAIDTAGRALGDDVAYTPRTHTCYKTVMGNRYVFVRRDAAYRGAVLAAAWEAEADRLSALGFEATQGVPSLAEV